MRNCVLEMTVLCVCVSVLVSVSSRSQGKANRVWLPRAGPSFLTQKEVDK